ncbi:trehalose/maltose hydrolase or phosphorylase [Rivularia sp. PCC 7116]|uniref:glycoside hydrolase family 65 protein n=1 Tax=Rivularia sp. PCC 7116 TaxID=373994 RepID=UPI00029F2245|nr:glycosyl hydrolase family 65 protein [Rivularia sp. PCC 7116]AFY58183.1 trehalose/maltose hydrolase or phosphorylase [Rivularia sp. PCC 7116]
MLRREPLNPPKYVYPVDEWRMVEKQYYPRFQAQMETIFSIGNGYLGMRGVCEEVTPCTENGTFINGFYESWPIVYGEEAFGFAKTGQTIVNVTDSKIIKLYVDDEPFSLSTANLLSFERVLDMKAGTLNRKLVWETPSGKKVAIKSRRLISLEHRHLAAIEYEVTLLNAKAPVVISSEMENHKHKAANNHDPRKAKGFKGRVLNPKVNYCQEGRVLLGYVTNQTKIGLACGIEHEILTDCSYFYKSECSEDDGKAVFNIDALPGVPIKLIKYITYNTSPGHAIEELCTRAHRTLDRAEKLGFEAILASQQQYMDEFWHKSDIKIYGNPYDTDATRALELQQAIRFNLFQILQASARAEGTGIPAKGLSGQAYEGQFFWDTEIYVLPFLIYTAPRIARNLLQFRYKMLDKARKRARQLNQKGALFPWRTINGEEASAYYAAGTAQYHINADIAYAIKKYVEITGDKDFLYNEGVEILVETARLWHDLGFFQDGKFHIHGVTGPDEYTTVVNNNAYTNLMARENLRYAAQTVQMLQNEDLERFSALLDRTNLALVEIEEWQKAVDNMYIPYDEAKGIHPQDDSFLSKKVWDFENVPRSKYPLLLNFHPLVIYRHQVIKQADVVLAMHLLGQEFSEEQKKRNFDYYDPLTTGDSSLSVCIQSILAFQLGYSQKALEYAYFAVLMDLADIAGNSKDGCHIASMGGSWMLMVYGFAGMKDYNGNLSFHPRLPKGTKRLHFPLTICCQRLEVDIRQEEVTYLLREGSELRIKHQDEEILLKVGVPVCIKQKVQDWE